MTATSQVRLQFGARPGNNPGQVVHTHVPLSPSSIIWYRLHRWEGKLQYMGEVWLTTHYCVVEIYGVLQHNVNVARQAQEDVRS